MEQQRALNALEPFLALSKSATSPRAAADLVMQATSAPQTYIFAELLQTPNIQALTQSPEYIAHLRLLEIFAWGSYAEYKCPSRASNNPSATPAQSTAQANPHQATPDLPPLSPAQTTKLQLLSLLPLLSTHSNPSYSQLTASLSLPTTQALESLIKAAIYANLISASLDPLHQTVRVTSVAPLRDLPPGSVPAMLALLVEWEGRCGDTLAGIEAKIGNVREGALRQKQRVVRDEGAFEAELAKVDEKSGGLFTMGMRGGESGKKLGIAQKWGSLLAGRGGKRSAPGEYGGVGGADDEMEVDDEEGVVGVTRSSKRKGLR